MAKQEIKRVKHWCDQCDTAITSGTVCPNCGKDISKEKVKLRKKHYKEE
jgi:hypothetical protein